MGTIAKKTLKPTSLKELFSQLEQKTPDFRPLVGKRLLVVSCLPERINTPLVFLKEHTTPALIGKDGISNVKIELDKDAFIPTDTINMRIIVDNTKSDCGVKRIKVKLIRHIGAVSSNGTVLEEMACLIKQKDERGVPANK